MNYRCVESVYTFNKEDGELEEGITLDKSINTGPIDDPVCLNIPATPSCSTVGLESIRLRYIQVHTI